MGKLHYLPTATNAHARLLNQMAGDMIGMHPDEQVAAHWAVMARESLQRYPGPPPPSVPVLDLDEVPELSHEGRQKLQTLARRWQESYYQDVRMQLMSVHRDLLGLQRRVAELELQQDRQQDEQQDRQVP